MVVGFDPLRRGLQIKMHAVVNDAARKIEDRINTVEPKFNAKSKQTGDNDTSAQVTVYGSAELSKEKHDHIKKTIEDAIKGSLMR